MNEKYQVTNKVTEVIYSHCEATASVVKATANGVVSRRRAAPSGYQRETIQNTKCLAIFMPCIFMSRGPIYKISYDLSYDYRTFIVTLTYDSDLKHAEISLRNIVS